MSPRAAWRLETLGFAEVYDYVPGRADWAASGRPVEGAFASVPTIGALAHRDVPTCALDERVADVAERVRDAGWSTCLVTIGRGVVLGRLFRRELDAPDERTAEQAMRPGPSTFRPNVSAHEMMHYMDEHDLRTAIVTTSDGTLVGIVRKEELA
jgi:CBS domain-containing protein